MVIFWLLTRNCPAWLRIPNEVVCSSDKGVAVTWILVGIPGKIRSNVQVSVKELLTLLPPGSLIPVPLTVRV